MKSGEQFQNSGVLLSGSRPVPSRVEVEKALLGCLLTDPKELEFVASKLNNESAFYNSVHQIIYSCLVQMDNDKKVGKIDLVTLADKLEERGELEQVGGASYLAELSASIPTTANLETYIKIVQDYSAKRALIKYLIQFLESCYDDSQKAINILDELETQIKEISKYQVEKEAISLTQAIVKQMDEVDRYHKLKAKDPNALLGLSTGFRDLNRITNGLKKGEMYVLAARPSMGKTTLAMNIAVNVALDDTPVAVFSLEMDAPNLAMRAVCAHSKTSPKNIYSKVDNNTFLKFTKSAGVLSGLPIYINDSAGIDVLQIRAVARGLKKKHKIGLIVIDYLQIISSTSSGGKINREREVALISSGIKNLAKELEIPIIILSQLNRSADAENNEPGLEHLRESGAIEQDADVIAIISGNRKQKNELTSVYYSKNDKDEKMSEAKKCFEEGFEFRLLIAKNRNGETGPIRLRFFPHQTRFADEPMISKKEKEYEKSSEDEEQI